MKISTEQGESRAKEPGTITKCLRLRHFERFPQVDVRRLKWHFIHPLTKFGNRGKINRNCS
jgi:hypothetical protein